MNQVGARSGVDPSQIESHFTLRCRRVVRLPWDPHLASGGQIEPASMRKRTRQAYLELSAAVGEGFALGAHT